MDEILYKVAEQTPVIAVLLAWVIAERRDKQDTLTFYRNKLTECHNDIAKALQKLMNTQE